MYDDCWLAEIDFNELDSNEDTELSKNIFYKHSFLFV